MRIGFGGISRRFGASLVIVVGTACTIGVLISISALAAGLQQAYVQGGSDTVAVVLGRDAGFEWASALSRSDVLGVMGAPGIARTAPDSGGVPFISAEVSVQLPPVPHTADGSLRVRGVPLAGTGSAIRPNFHITYGRMFRPGTQELIIGAGAARTHGADIGTGIIMPDGRWPIVGTFSDGGSITESELMGDAETIMATMKRSAFTSMLVVLDKPSSFGTFAEWLADRPDLHLSAERQPIYLERAGRSEAQYFRSLAIAIGLVMATGALFACMKILYASVSARSTEMATLRAMGYTQFPVAASVMAEGLVLALAGGLLGGLGAWLLFNGHHAADYNRTFTMAVTPKLILSGIAWAAVLAIVGGIAPAVRAARLHITDVLRGA